MTRGLAPLLAWTCLPGLALAQADLSARLHPAPSARDAGIYHVATDSWTRPGSVHSLGLEVSGRLYDNSCGSATFLLLGPTDSMTDSGRLPSLSSPTAFDSLTGTGVRYDITSFEIGYCSDALSVDGIIAFYECYEACQQTAPVPTAEIAFSGLPGGGGTGTLTCWTITIDLAGTTDMFALAADCDGAWLGGGLDLETNFGWGLSFPSMAPTNLVGPLSAGDPDGLFGQACARGDGTIFANNGSTQGTGLGTQDLFAADIAGVPVNCFFFGGYGVGGKPYSSFYLRMDGDTTPLTGVTFCDANGTSSVPCPCDNDSNGEHLPTE